jgi:hypothetical protein
MAALPIGHKLVQPPAGQHEAADMLRQVARKTGQLVADVEHLRDDRVGGIKACFLQSPV